MSANVPHKSPIRDELNELRTSLEMMREHQFMIGLSLEDMEPDEALWDSHCQMGHQIIAAEWHLKVLAGRVPGRAAQPALSEAAQSDERNISSERLSVEMNEAIAEVVRLARARSPYVKLEDALFALEDRIVFELERGAAK